MRKKRITWKRAAAAAACVVGLVLGLILLAPPSKIGEKVKYRMNATFTYRESDENLPVENIYIGFPCPNADNEIGPWERWGTWSLYWQDENGELHLQASQLGEGVEEHELHPPRTSVPEIQRGIGLSTFGPRLGFYVDKLYSGEVLWVVAWVENVDPNVKITLREHSDSEGRSSASLFKFSPEGPLDFPIDVSFWATLDNYHEIVEEFSRTLDNITAAKIWLYP